jgi:16S rRNA (cytidine1402-2'-O)-methyltransferase
MSEFKKGKLYIVPTPIGNLADMTFRAVDILKSVSIIGAEDTRTSAKLLKHYEIGTQMISYHKFNERSRIEKMLGILRSGEDVAIISDAGTPGISDPSSLLISKVLEADFKVETLPGATAFVPALIGSGLNCERFCFHGFLPDKISAKMGLLHYIIDDPFTQIFYEAPHRLFKTLNLLLDVLGNRKIALAREISKLHETFYRSTLHEITSKPELIKLKGEFVIVLEGAFEEEITDAQLIKMLQERLNEGESKKNAVKIVMTKTGIARNRIYDLAIQL